MRIPGLRTGLMKNPVGFAVRAALNDKSGTGRSSGSRRSSSSSARSSYSRSNYSTTSYKTSGSSLTSSNAASSHSENKSVSKPISYSDSEHNYSSVPNIYLDRGLIRAYGYTYAAAKKKALALAMEKFGAAEDKCKVVELPFSPADQYKYGAEIVVDIESMKKAALADLNRYYFVYIENLFSDFEELHYSKNYHSYRNTIKENDDLIKKTQRAIKNIEEYDVDMAELKETNSYYLGEVNKLQEMLGKCGFFAFSKKSSIKKELKRMSTIQKEIEARIKELEDKQERGLGLSGFKDRLDSVKKENEMLREFCKKASAKYEYNVVKEEVLYARLLDKYIISVLIKQESKKQLLLEDERIKAFVDNNPDVYTNLPNPRFTGEENGVRRTKYIFPKLQKEDKAGKEEPRKEERTKEESCRNKATPKNRVKADNPKANYQTYYSNPKEKTAVISPIKEFGLDSQLNNKKTVITKKADVKAEAENKNTVKVVTAAQTDDTKKCDYKQVEPAKSAKRIPVESPKVVIREKMKKIIEEMYCTDDAYKDMFVCLPNDDVLIEKQDIGNYRSVTKSIDGLSAKLRHERCLPIKRAYSEKTIDKFYDDYYLYNFSIRKKQYMDRMEFLERLKNDVKEVIKGLRKESEKDEFRMYIKDIQKEVSRINIKYLRCEDSAANELFMERLYKSLSDPEVLRKMSEYPDTKEILIHDPVLNKIFPQSLRMAGLIE